MTPAGPRVLVLPAAGTGSRLGSSLPKVLHPVAGRPMLAHLADLHRRWIDRWHVVVRPADTAAVEAACASLGLPATLHVQPAPTGMLDAVLRPLDAVHRDAPSCVWITWCDQIGIHAETLARLAALPCGDDLSVTLPTCCTPDPYIHLDRDRDGRIHAVRHRRERDAMPAEGETDAGLFALSARAYLEELPRYAAAPDAAGAVTGERNFLPFLPWIARAGHVVTFPVREREETIGVNTPDDLSAIEAYFARR